MELAPKHYLELSVLTYVDLGAKGLKTQKFEKDLSGTWTITTMSHAPPFNTRWHFRDLETRVWGFA